MNPAEGNLDGVSFCFNVVSVIRALHAVSMDAEESAVTANQQLESIYSARMDEWKALRLSQKEKGEVLSIPFFLKAEPAYFDAPIKCLFVGQESHGWWTDCKILPSDLRAEQIMDFYVGNHGGGWSLITRQAYGVFGYGTSSTTLLNV